MKKNKKKKTGGKKSRKPKEKEKTMKQNMLFQIWVDTEETKNLLRIFLEDVYENPNSKTLHWR